MIERQYTDSGYSCELLILDRMRTDPDPALHVGNSVVADGTEPVRRARLEYEYVSGADLPRQPAANAIFGPDEIIAGLRFERLVQSAPSHQSAAAFQNPVNLHTVGMNDGVVSNGAGSPANGDSRRYRDRPARGRGSRRNGLFEFCLKLGARLVQRGRSARILRQRGGADQSGNQQGRFFHVFESPSLDSIWREK